MLPHFLFGHTLINIFCFDNNLHVFASELFSVPVLSIHPAEVFEGENFTISCQISSFASEKIQREDITYSIFRDKTSVINSNKYSGTAGKVTNGEYWCTANANGITKKSQRELFGAKGRQCLVNLSVLET